MPEENIVKPQISAPSIGEVIPSEPKLETDSKVEQSQDSIDKLESKDPGDFDIVGEDYLTNPMWYEVVTYLNIDPSEYSSSKNEIVEIVRYVAREIKSREPEDILPKLKEIRSNLYDKGQWGEKLHKVLYRYIRLAAKKQAIQKEMGAFEK